VSQKTTTHHLTFEHYFGKCRPIFPINLYKVFHLILTVLLHYLAKFKKYIK